MSELSFDPNGPKVQKLRDNIRRPVAMRMWMLSKLPLAWVAGLRVTALDAERCAVTVPYGWKTQNPFRSTYFAAQSMAAEMSTGALALVVVTAAPQPVSMLITGLTAEFVKKVSQTLTFTCSDGRALQDVVMAALHTGEAQSYTATTVGTLPDGTVAARFTFTWSFKRKGT